MQMKRLIAIAVIVMLSTAASASDRFYESSKTGDWKVFGVFKNKDNPNSVGDSCLMQRDYDDGSYVQLFKDLNDNEILMWVKNSGWNFVLEDEKEKQGIATFVFRNAHKKESGPKDFRVQGRHLIVFRQLNEKFLVRWFEDQDLTVEMPGSINDVKIVLINTRKALEELAECVSVYNKLPKKQFPIIPNATERKA